MTAEQLEELLGKVTQGDIVACATDDHSLWIAIGSADGELLASINTVNPYDAKLLALAPSLARRVIAAEKLVNALEEMPLGDCPLAQLVTAYREASK